ncbi:MAG: DUF6067 family protein [Verrucomicrobiae bacterium]|nr:DUF6067 family protein [Verrucomicrobiae bacterium]
MEQYGADLNFSFQPADPVYLQIEKNFRRLIETGQLGPNQRLPSARQLAKVWNVDFKTVRHAFGRCVIIGIIFVLSMTSHAMEIKNACVLSADLIGHWPFDREGMDVDISQKRNHLENIDNVEQVVGRCGEAIKFNGKQSCAYLNFSNVSIKKGMTIITWIKFYKTGCHNNIFTTDSIKMMAKADDHIYFSLKTHQGIQEIVSEEMIGQDRWIHVAGKWDGQRMYLYIDGKPQGYSRKIADPSDLDGKAMLGSESCMILDEFKLYNGPLGKKEIEFSYKNPERAQYSGYVVKDMSQDYSWFKKTHYSFKYAFDFGSDDSSLRPGFHRITANDPPYNGGKGFGWSAGGGRWGIDRKLEKPQENKNIIYRDSANALTKDFVEGKEDGEFTIDLPDGNYRICLVVGDKDDIPPIFSVYSSNEKLAELSLPGKYIFRVDEYPVRVVEGKLRLRFHGEFGWLINGLIVYPEKDIPLAKEEIKKIKYEIELGDPEYISQFLQYEFKEKNKTIFPEKTQYCIFSRNYLSHIHQNTIPQNDEINKKICIRAALGEFEPATFSIHSLMDLEDVKMEASDLTDACGNKIDKSFINIKIVKFIYRALISYANPSKYMSMPTLLEDFLKINIPKNSTSQFWMTIKVPEDAVPGKYESRILIRPKNAASLEMALELKVLPFKLCNPEIHIGMCYSYPMINKQRGRWDGQWKRMEREFVDMKEHGMNCVVPVCGWHGLSGWNIPGEDEFKIDTVLRSFVTAKKTGLNYPINWHYLPVLGKFEKFKDILSDLTREIEKNSLPQLIFYPCDEPYTEGRAKEAIAIGTYIKKEIPFIKLSITFSTGTMNMLEKRVDLLEKLLDIYDIIRVSPLKVSKEIKEKIKAKGKSFCIYNNPVSWFTTPPQTRYCMGYLSWKWGIEGTLLWHYQIYYYHKNPFNPIDNNKYPQCDVYPGEDGPISTIDWEIRREGIDDYRYIKTLEKTILEAKSQKMEKRKELIENAEKLLSNLNKKIDPVLKNYTFRDKNTGEPLENEKTWRADEYDKARMEISDMILKLKSPNE